MQVITLYRYIRDDGGITISPIKPNKKYDITYRLIADENKILINGDISTECTDTDEPNLWIETDK